MNLNLHDKSVVTGGQDAARVIGEASRKGYRCRVGFAMLPA